MRRLPFALIVAAVAILPSAARAEERLDARSRAAVDRGLAWLAAKWSPEAVGAAELAGARGEPSTVTAALAGLAFLSAGAADAPDGPYAASYAACLKRVLAGQQEDGLFSPTPRTARCTTTRSRRCSSPTRWPTRPPTVRTPPP
jgi:hypothetical protein